MGSCAIVVLPPRLDGVSSIAQANEPMAVETFVAQSSMKALDKRVLHRLARFNEAQLDAPLVGPLIDGLASQLRSVIQHDLIWGTALDGQPLQHPHHSP